MAKRKIIGALPPIGRAMGAKHAFDRTVDPAWKRLRKDDKPKAGGLIMRLRLKKARKGRK